MSGSILLVAGPPGAGKSTISALLAAASERSVVLPTDDSRTWIAKAHMDPWRAGSSHQNVAIFTV